MLTRKVDVSFSSILIVDNEVGLASALRTIYQLDGIEARACHSSEEAIELLRKFRPDVVLLDLKFGPGKRDGMEALPDILRASPGSCVLMYTGYGDITKAVEAIHAGAWDMIQKGAHSPPELIAIIRERYRKKSEYEQLAMERNRLVEKEATRETARQLASGIVHDAAHRVQECSFLLQRIGKLTSSNELVKESINDALTSLSKMDETLTLLGQFSEIPHAETEPVKLLSVLSSSIEDCQKRLHAMNNKEIVISLLDAKSNVSIEGNERLLKMALLALLQNACESQEKNGGEVFVSTEVAEGQVTISIVDRGAGISENHLPKIGTRCFTTKGSAGNGLGVLFATAVAARSNGSFELKNNNPPPGAIAIMRLPIVFSKQPIDRGLNHE